MRKTHDEINAALGTWLKTGELTDVCPVCRGRGKEGTFDEWIFCRNCAGSGKVPTYYKDQYNINYCKDLVYAHNAARSLLEKCTESQTPRLWHYWVKRLCHERGLDAYLAPPDIIAQATAVALGRVKP